MKLRARNGLLLLLTAALVVVSAGCPNSTVITAGIGTTQVAIVMANPSRFQDDLPPAPPPNDRGTFTIRRLMIRPVDPDANQALGPARDIALFRTGIFVNTADPMVDPSFLTPTTLSQGVYEIIEIQFTQTGFFDAATTDPSTCESFIKSYFLPTVTVASFAVPQQFTVVNGQETMLTLTFDLTNMMTTINNAHTCTPLPAGGFSATNFDPNQFAADTLDYLTFN